MLLFSSVLELSFPSRFAWFLNAGLMPLWFTSLKLYSFVTSGGSRMFSCAVYSRISALPSGTVTVMFSFRVFTVDPLKLGVPCGGYW